MSAATRETKFWAYRVGAGRGRERECYNVTRAGKKKGPAVRLALREGRLARLDERGESLGACASARRVADDGDGKLAELVAKGKAIAWARVESKVAFFFE